MARILLHQLVSERPMPEVAKRSLQANHSLLTELISEGPRDGSIPGERETFHRLVENAVGFVRGGLAAAKEAR